MKCTEITSSQSGSDEDGPPLLDSFIAVSSSATYSKYVQKFQLQFLNMLMSTWPSHLDKVSHPFALLV